VDPNSFFSDSDPTNFLSDSDPYTNILTRNFLTWCLSLLYMFYGICTTEKKVFQLKNLGFFSFICLMAIFHKFFYFTQCLDPNPNPNFFSDSDPAKTIEFFRIRIHNTATVINYVEDM
jgi:hypothetical protein